MPIRLAPAAALFTAMSSGLLFTVLLLVLGIHQPWLGLKLTPEYDTKTVRIVAVDEAGSARDVSPGSTLVSLTGTNGRTIVLQGGDLIEEPDTLDSYAEMRAFFERQSIIDGILRSGLVELEFHDSDGAITRTTVEPHLQRPFTSLPAAFWVQVFVGLVSFWIAAWIWSVRNTELPTRIFALVGAGIPISSFPAAFYSTRELAVNGEWFAVLSIINHLGTFVFGAGMIALFLVYPRPLVNARWLLVLPLLFGLWWLGDVLRLYSGPPVGIHLPSVLAMIGILVGAGLQYWKTRNDPVARAALNWLGLSVVIGAGSFVATVLAPNLIGAPPVFSQGLAFIFFLVIYIGVALGVARYRLFMLEEWAFRILFYMSGVMLLIVIDALLILALPLERIPAFGLALLLVAFAYLPFRDALARFFLHRRAPDHEHLFRKVMDVALAPHGHARNARWRALLQDGFNPLHLDTVSTAVDVAIVDDGLVLLIPGTGDLPAYRLSYAHAGRKLFSLRDAATARELTALLNYALESRAAYEKGMMEERMRIARDMHDNIGIQLLGALHSRDSGRKDVMIRDTLADLRDIINNASRPELSLCETLADLRTQTSEHLSSAGIELKWRNEVDDMPTLPLSATHAVRSFIREAIQNVIRHAQASTVEVAIRRHNDHLSIVLVDDGKGFDVDDSDAGNGLTNMRSRISRLQGYVEIFSQPGGTRIVAQMPLAGLGV